LWCEARSWRCIARLPDLYIETENWQPKGEPVSLSPILPRWFKISGLQTLWSRMPISISRSVALGEPNELATNSRFFRLAARCPGLAGNGQYCGETVALWYAISPTARNRTRL